MMNQYEKVMNIVEVVPQDKGGIQMLLEILSLDYPVYDNIVNLEGMEIYFEVCKDGLDNYIAIKEVK